MKIIKFFIYSLTFFGISCISGCGVYSFSGVAITAETLTIQNFFNDAQGGPPDLSQRFTNTMQDYFQRNTNLVLVPDNGEIIIEGVITNYQLQSLGATQQTVNNQQVDVAADTKLVITVKVSYINIKDDQFNFESRSFTQFEPFSNEQNFSTIEDQLLEVIFEKLMIDIFNATVANW